MHVLIVFRDFAASGLCHVGLGICALNTVRVLRRARVPADAYGIKNSADLQKVLQRWPNATHVIVEALFLPALEIRSLMRDYPRTAFVCRSHSQVGFLQVEAGAVSLLNDYRLLQDGDVGFSIAANNQRFCSFWHRTRGSPCQYLHNLYDLSPFPVRRLSIPRRGTLRISSFGAIRLLKNHATAAAAAQLIAKTLGRDLEFWISVNREENGKGVVSMLRNLFTGLTWAKLVESPWQPWPDFKATVSMMDLCLQVSFSETFNIATADAVSQGIPVVTGSAIEWVPKRFHADVDDANAVAHTGISALHDPQGPQECLEALQDHVHSGVAGWLSFLQRTVLT